MNVIDWSLKQLKNDSECCGNPLRCQWYQRDKHPQFHSCVGVSPAVEEVVEIEE